MQIALHLVGLALLNLLIFHGVYFSGDTFPADFSLTDYPLTAYWITSASAGEWPGWVPYVAGGYPFTAQPQSGALYPLLWVFPLLHIPYTLSAAAITQALHVLLGAVGAYFLAARLYRPTGVALIAGAAYMVYGGFYTSAQHADIVRAFALTPWMFWAFAVISGRVRSVPNGRYRSAIGMPALALPLITYLLITGGYPGCAVALLSALAVFGVIQLAQSRAAGQPLSSAVLDFGVRGALVLLGLLLAAPFLAPLLALGEDVSRSTALASQDRVYLQVTDLYSLVLHSARPPGDISMFGMQLPLVVLPFVAFVSGAAIKRLLPFIGVAALAVLMTFDIFTRISGALIRLVPIFGYSPSPTADFRTLLALTLLLVACGGIAEVLNGRVTARRASLTFGVILAGICVLLAPAVLLSSTAETLGPNARTAGLQVVVAGAVCVVLLALGRRGTSLALPIWLAVLAAASAAPVLVAMEGIWRAPFPELLVREATGLSASSASDPAAHQVFSQRYLSRPARITDRDPLTVYWAGYLDGQFRMNGDGGAALNARDRLKTPQVAVSDSVARLIQANPSLLAPAYQRLLIQDRGWVFYVGEPHGPDGLPAVALPAASGETVSPEDLTAFVEQPSTLLAVRCPDRTCATLDPAHVGLSGPSVLAAPDFQWTISDYSRSSISYHLTLSQPALVLENELFAHGWQGVLGNTQSGGRSPIKIDGSVRGWVLPDGDYDFHVSFTTPGLGLGLLFGAAALMVYAMVAVAGAWVLRARYDVALAQNFVAAEPQRLPTTRAQAVGRALAALLVVHLFVAWMYVWFATGGKYEFRGDGGYYGWLSDAFLAHQTYLTINPPPELLALADPYDPQQHGKVSHPVPDGSLYKGHYYLYFGPVPGVLHALWQKITASPLPANAIMLAFGYVACMFIWLLLRELRNETFPRLRSFFVYVAFISIALGGVGLYLQARPIIHHEAIAAASMFVAAGAYFWLRALRSPGSGWLNLVASGICFGLAVGSRTTEAAYVVGIGLVLLHTLVTRANRRVQLQRLFAFGTPVSVAVAALLAYNYVRFDSPFEFGTRYVLTGIQNLYNNPLGVFDVRAVPDNVVAYFSYWPFLSPYFPFVVANPGFVPPIPSGLGYAVEPPFMNLFVLAPLLLFSPIAGYWVIRKWAQLTSATRGFVVSTGIGLLGALTFVLFTNFASGRYAEEILPLTGVLCALGLWWLADRLAERQFVTGLGVVLGTWSVLAGGLLGVWELGLYPDAFQGLAYPVDTAEAVLVQNVDPALWPASYLSDTPRQRPWGTFYPDGAVVRFAVLPGLRVSELNLWSIFRHSTSMRVSVNGLVMGTWPVAPGQVRITFPQPIAVNDSHELNVELAFPDEKDHPLLWPISVATITQIGQ